MANINWDNYINYPTDPLFYPNAGYRPEWPWFIWPTGIPGGPVQGDGSGSGSGDGDGDDDGRGQGIRELYNKFSQTFPLERRNEGLGSANTEAMHARVGVGDPYRAAAQLNGPLGYGLKGLGVLSGPGAGAIIGGGGGLATAGYTLTGEIDPRLAAITNYQGYNDSVAANRAKAAALNKALGIGTSPWDAIKAFLGGVFRNPTKELSGPAGPNVSVSGTNGGLRALDGTTRGTAGGLGGNYGGLAIDALRGGYAERMAGEPRSSGVNKEIADSFGGGLEGFNGGYGGGSTGSTKGIGGLGGLW